MCRTQISGWGGGGVTKRKLGADGHVYCLNLGEGSMVVYMSQPTKIAPLSMLPVCWPRLSKAADVTWSCLQQGGSEGPEE